MFGGAAREAVVLKNVTVFPCALSTHGHQTSGWAMPSLRAGAAWPWSLHFGGEASTGCPQGPRSLALRFGVSSKGSAFCGLLRPLPPELPLWDQETCETGVSLGGSQRAVVHSWLAPVRCSSGHHRLVGMLQNSFRCYFTAQCHGFLWTSPSVHDMCRYLESLLRMWRKRGSKCVLPPTGTCDFSKPRTSHCDMGVTISTLPKVVWGRWVTTQPPSLQRD